MAAWFALAAVAQGCAHGATPRAGEDAAAQYVRYFGLVVRELRSSYVLPRGVLERGNTHLKVALVLYIEPDGRVARWVIESPSGDPEFDDAAAAMVQRAHLPPPPEALRETLRSKGVGVNFHL